MKNSCSSVSPLIERYFDRQATDEERALVERHLPVCTTCSEKLMALEGLKNALKAPVDEALQEETFPWVWEKIEKNIRMERKPSWWNLLRSWLDLSYLLRKRVWIPAVATAIVLALIISPFLFQKTPSYLEASVVEYVESDTHNVMVYDLETGQVTVIWLFEEPEEETFSS
ncbi:MAG: hypothetical protein FJ110_05215 [Deltaproteobacteria bacterium]|nr:hypothetical protein [Deltaproteobacteria bacterium]